MEQVKYLYRTVKSFIIHHKTVSLFIAFFIILDISLIGVIADMQQKQTEAQTSSSITITPTQGPSSSH